MERWRGVLKVPLKNPGGIPTLYRVAVSLCLSTASKTLAVPSANAILFQGDRVAGTRSTVIQRLSDPQKLADILVSKFGDSVNAWVIEASLYNGPFAVYRDFIPAVNQWGEPKSKSYDPSGFPASNSTVSLLSSCLHEIKLQVASSSNGVSPALPTYILGFSKGGTVINQLVTELSCLEHESGSQEQRVGIVPENGEDLLSSITEVHYVDVGLNSAGAYVTDHGVIERIGKRLNVEGAGGRVRAGIRFVLHGTPRQWCDDRRGLIREEKDELIRLLEIEAGMSGAGKLQVCQTVYFSDRVPDMEMHFEILEAMDVS